MAQQRQAAARRGRLIQTRVTWPLSDALPRAPARAAIATSAATVAIAAALGGALSATDHPAASPPIRAAAVATAAPTSHQAVALQGVAPQIQPGHAAPPPPQPPAKTSAPPEQVAWQFAGAFVAYEVGRSSRKTDAVFADTATKQLAKSLTADPPRLPPSGKDAQARVLNVVLGTPTKTQVTASVSLVRLRAISEVRLILAKTGEAWRVAQVLG